MTFSKINKLKDKMKLQKWNKFKRSVVIELTNLRSSKFKGMP